MNKKTHSACAKEALCGQPFICPLNQVRAGTAVRVKVLSAPPDVTRRLLSQKTNIICQVCNVRLAISSQLAEKIWVEPLPGQRFAA